MRLDRAALLRTTALVVLATPALSQPAPNARPTGGSVSAGQATISASANATVINQTSQNAALNWQSFNVGSAQTVQFRQPNSRSVALNRVLSASPSQIAGYILANGQVVLVNQSGVVFTKGSQVNAAGLVVSAAGITDQNLMSGHMVFDQAAHPGAIVSNAGNITIRQAGLAALVAPQVANSGVISANLGRVILGGAVTHTLDLYGDGLVAFNVTGQVTQASVGGQKIAALVTNSGTILAPGGTVVLSAGAADGVVSNLVSAGGNIAAQTVGAQQGRVLIQGVGGGVEVDGTVSANGVAMNTAGGHVEVNATGAVTLAPGSAIDVSGDAGGGVAAIGTTMARAIGGASVAPSLTAMSVNISRGATVRADATRRGRGGRVTLLSKSLTTQSGILSAQGGPQGGDGGWIEVSGGGQLNLAGQQITAAPLGRAGTLFIDPANLIIGNSGAGTNTALITPAQFNAFTGNVILKADGTLTVAAPATLNAQATSLELEGDQGIIIGATLDARGRPVFLDSPGGSITDVDGNATGNILADTLAATSRDGNINLTNGASLFGTIGAFAASGETVSGTIVTIQDGVLSGRQPTLQDSNSFSGVQDISNDVLLTDGAPLVISEPVTAGGNITIDDVAPAGVMTLAANILANNIDIVAAAINQTAGLISAFDGTLALSSTAASGGGISIGGTLSSVVFSESGNTTGLISLDAASGDVSIGGVAQAGTFANAAYSGSILLSAGLGNITETLFAQPTPTGVIEAGTLAAQAGQSIVLDAAKGNTIGSIATAGTLAGLVAGGDITLNDDERLSLVELVSGRNVTLASQSDIILGGTLQAGSLNPDTGIYSGTASLSAVGTIGYVQNGDTSSPVLDAGIVTGSAASVLLDNAARGNNGNQIASLGPFSTNGGFVLLDGQGLTITGPVINVAGPISIDTVAGDIVLAGTLQAGTNNAGVFSGSATLTADTGNITETVPGQAQPSGVLLVGTLTGSAGVDLALATVSSPTSGNQIAALGPFTVNDSLVLVDGQALDITGPVLAELVAPANPSASLLEMSIHTPALTIAQGAELGLAQVTDGSGFEPAGLISLVADSFLLNGPVITPGGTVALDLLHDGRFTIAGEGSTIPGLQQISTATGTLGGPAGTIALGSLDGVSQSPGGTGASWSAQSGGLVTALNLSDAVDVSGQATSLGLFSNEAITSSAGITTGTLYGSAGGVLGVGNTSITGTNDIAVLGSFLAQGQPGGLPALFDLTDGAALSVAGPVSAPAGVVEVKTTQGNLSIGGAIQAATVSLAASTGAILEASSGTLAAANLTAQATGDITLDSPNNLIANIGGGVTTSGVVANGVVGIVDNETLGVSGTVAGVGAVAIDVTQGDLDIGGTIRVTAGETAASNAVLQAGNGSIVESLPGQTTPTGVIVAGTLSGAAGGNLLLNTASSPTTGNQIAQVGDFNANGLFVLVDGQAVGIQGAVRAGLAAPASNAVAEMSITAPTLTVLQGGSLALAPSLNDAAQAPGGLISLVADSFVIDGGVTTPGGIVALDLLHDGAFTVGGAGSTLNSAANISTATGTIGGPAGTIALGSLDGVLPSPGSTGASWFEGEAGLVTGLTIAANLDLSTQASALGLFSNVSIASTGGLIVETLYGSAGGAGAVQANAVITGDNAISTLGQFTVEAATGNSLFQLADTAALTVAGPVAASSGAAQFDGGRVDISVTGSSVSGYNGLTLGTASISGFNIRLAADGEVSQQGSGGSLLTSQASGSPGGPLEITSNHSGVDFAGVIGGGTVLLSAAGDITEGVQGGVIAGTLAASGANIALGGNANLIGAIGPLANASGVTLAGLVATGNIVLNDTVSLTLGDASAATVSGASIVMDLGSGNLTQNGGGLSTAAGGFTLTAANFFQNAGTVRASGSIVIHGNLDQANGFTGSATDIVIDGGVSQDQGNIDATGNVGIGSFLQQTSGSVSAGGSVVMNAGTMLTQSAGATINGVAGVSMNVSGDIVQQGGGTIESGSGNVSLAAGGAITMNGGLVESGSGAVALAAGSDLRASEDTISAGGTAGRITLSAPGTIALGGLMSAANILIGNPDGPVTQSVEWNQNTIFTSSGLPAGRPAQDLGGPGGEGLSSTAPGVLVYAANFIQTGTTFVDPLSTTGLASIQITLQQPGGRISFNQAGSDGGGLSAPLGELLLLPGSGTAAGNINVGGLAVFDSLPGAVTLTGTVGGLAGSGAAGAGVAYPSLSAAYTLNSCEIGIAGCGTVTPILASGQLVPVFDPVAEEAADLPSDAALAAEAAASGDVVVGQVENAFVGTVRRRRESEDVILPDVGTVDY